MAVREYNDEYRKWRKAVLARDKHKCQWPDCRVKKGLQVHHIIRWHDDYVLRFAVTNGITLCRKHHGKIKNKEYYYVDMFLTILGFKL